MQETTLFLMMGLRSENKEMRLFELVISKEVKLNQLYLRQNLQSVTVKSFNYSDPF